jgi:hypothetical protein
MWSAVAGIIQIIYLLLKNKFEKDEEIKKQREAMKNEAKDSIKSMDATRISNTILNLRR